MPSLPLRRHRFILVFPLLFAACEGELRATLDAGSTFAADGARGSRQDACLGNGCSGEVDADFVDDAAPADTEANDATVPPLDAASDDAFVPPSDSGPDSAPHDGGPAGSCSNPHPLVFTNGHATATGTITGSTSSMSTGCYAPSLPSSGPEQVYSITVSSTQMLAATVTTPGENHEPTMYLLTGGCGGTELTCGEINGLPISYDAASIRWLLSPGTYYLVVDSGVNSAGWSTIGAAYTLDATLTTSDNSGNGCNNARMLTLSHGTYGTASITLRPTVFTPPTMCNYSYPNIVLMFETTNPHFIRMTVTATENVTGGAAGVLEKISACDSTHWNYCAASGLGSFGSMFGDSSGGFEESGQYVIRVAAQYATVRIDVDVE